MDAVKNFSKVQVSTGYDDTATSIVLESGEGSKLPQPSTDGPFNLVWFNVSDFSDPSDDPNVEIVRVTARSSDTLTITRAQEGTSATTKNESGKIYLMILGPTAKTISDLAWSAPGAVTGNINSSNKIFTLPSVPKNPNSIVIYLAGQFKLLGVDFNYTDATYTQVEYVEAPDESLAGLGHYAHFN